MLGEMLELGREAETLHRDVGTYIAEQGIDVLIGIRGAARLWWTRPCEAGCRTAPRFFSRSRAKRAISCVESARPGDAVLFKGRAASRSNRRWNALFGEAEDSRMLYWLLYEQLFPLVTPFRVFRYVTFRTAFREPDRAVPVRGAGALADLANCGEFQIGQHIREDGPKSHQKKAGTPTMGGVLIIISHRGAHAAVGRPAADPYVWVALFGAGCVRRHRLHRRLCQGHEASATWALTARQKFAAADAGGSDDYRAFCWSCRRTAPIPPTHQRSVFQAVSAGPADPFAAEQSVYVSSGVSAVLRLSSHSSWWAPRMR